MTIFNLVIYGGTFDPVHNGHLQTAINIQNYFNFDKFIFLPCKNPVLKKVQTAVEHRLAMLRLALEEINTGLNHKFSIDLTEIKRDSPSYMIDSLKSFRHIYGLGIAINIIIGDDNLVQLPKWHQWEKLLNYSNFLIIKRNNNSLIPKEIKNLLNYCQTKDAKLLKRQAQGLIYFFDAGSYPFSSTAIREAISDGKLPMTTAIPATVLEYIKLNNLYNSLS